MRKMMGVYVHDETLAAVPTQACGHCGMKMKMFSDLKRRFWWMCTASPTKCGLVYPADLSPRAVRSVLKAFNALRKAGEPNRPVVSLVEQATV